MERREKRALAFLLAASLLCLALERGGGRQPLLCAQAGARVVLL